MGWKIANALEPTVDAANTATYWDGNKWIQVVLAADQALANAGAGVTNVPFTTIIDDGLTAGTGLNESAGGNVSVDFGTGAGEVPDANEVIYKDGSVDFTAVITGVTPTADLHLATKGYVDALAQGLDVKASVRLNSDDTSNEGTTYAYAPTGGTSARGQITWATGPTTIDSITLVNGDRILNTESGAAGGIWLRTGANTWDRAPDFDENDEVTPGAFTFIEEGTVYEDSGWVLTTDDPGGGIIIGGGSGTVLDWAQFSGAGSIVAGTGLTKSGATINLIGAAASALTIAADSVAVNPDGTTIEINGTGPGALRVVPLGINNAEIATLAAIEFTKMEALTANRVLISDASGDLIVHTTISDTELGFLNGVASTVLETDDKGAVSGVASLDANQLVNEKVKEIDSGVFSALPSVGTAGQMFVATDGAGGLGGDPVLYVDLN